MTKKFKAQSSLEFTILVGFVMVAFTVFFIIIQQNLSEKTKEKENIRLKEVGLTIQNEINLARTSIKGYQRSFTIPLTIYGKEYEANITEGLLQLKTTDGKHSIVYPVGTITGQINKPNNTITNKEGEILLNE